jgi:hypothetical protein
LDSASFRFINPRHPRVLARIRPTQLGLWSSVVAIAHGAGLMLVPIYLGLCRAADLDKGHKAATALINANLRMAILVSTVHSVAMIAAGAFAWLVHRYLGLKLVTRSWFNLDATWTFSLVLVGALSLAFSLATGFDLHCDRPDLVGEIALPHSRWLCSALPAIQGAPSGRDTGDPKVDRGASDAYPLGTPYFTGE